jgi:hypothetical protein
MDVETDVLIVLCLVQNNYILLAITWLLKAFGGWFGHPHIELCPIKEKRRHWKKTKVWAPGHDDKPGRNIVHIPLFCSVFKIAEDSSFTNKKSEMQIHL